MRAVVCFGTLVVISLTAVEVTAQHADSQEAREARARAALALAAAAPAQAAAPPAPRCGCKSCECGESCECRTGTGCLTCLPCARAEAAGKRPLALWVGGETRDGHADVRAALHGHVHAHLATFNGSAAPRLLVECGPDAGEYWRFDGGAINAAAVRRAVNPPPEPPPPPAVPLSYNPPAASFGACRT